MRTAANGGHAHCSYLYYYCLIFIRSTRPSDPVQSYKANPKTATAPARRTPALYSLAMEMAIAADLEEVAEAELAVEEPVLLLPAAAPPVEEEPEEEDVALPVADEEAAEEEDEDEVAASEAFFAPHFTDWQVV